MNLIDWKDLKKEKPNDFQIVLCYIESRSFHVVCQYNSEEQSFKDIYGESHSDITHWSELTIPSVDNWIPVCDKLPPEAERVLVCNVDDPEGDVYADMFFWEDKEATWMMRGSNPTHWMPIPAKKVKNG